ncbi:conserved hypothetical protein, partial [Trichinella spiralis]|uniref:hypothetical protein n=1 Tax=Trichinella spiralis TaxID=6334 RepID=UPI0001EFD423
GNSQIRENSFLDFGSQTAESSEDATTASEWILIEEKASEGDEDGKHDSTDVRTVEAQYVQEMKVSEEATTMIANCQNEKSAKKANAASEKLGIAEENASDNPNVLVRNLWLIYILLSYAINYAFVFSFQDEFYGNKRGNEYYANMSDVDISDDDGTLSSTRICHYLCKAARHAFLNFLLSLKNHCNPPKKFCDV